jgi:hypothetical protein
LSERVQFLKAIKGTREWRGRHKTKSLSDLVVQECFKIKKTVISKTANKKMHPILRQWRFKVRWAIALKAKLSL